jgi:hypothetical protein
LNRTDELKRYYLESGISEFLTIKREDDYPDKGMSSLRFKSNEYRIRAIEIWETDNDGFFRIYHGPEIAAELKTRINEIEGNFKSVSTWSDFRGNFEQISKELYAIISNDKVIEVTKQNLVLSRNSAYEGLSLPDVDTSDTDVFGRVFTWKEILTISEDLSEENDLKNVLSKCGVYLQRSIDGKSRYVGSAYGEGGILQRWLKHLNSNGNAKHLNLFVLENGYSDIVFTVLEFTAPEKALEAEKRWKLTLGTQNSGPYDSIRLNNN